MQRYMNYSNKTLLSIFTLVACAIATPTPLLAIESARSESFNLNEHLSLYNQAVSRIYARKANTKDMVCGTCFLVDGKGLYITNFHVINGCDVFVTFITNAQTGKVEIMPLEPVRIDIDNDLALLQTQVPFPLPTPLKLSEQPPEILGKVVAIGFPALVDEVVTAIDLVRGSMQNSTRAEEEAIPNYTQGNITKVTSSSITHDAKIARGNSGGPLISGTTGEVVGINRLTASDTGSTFFFAIPSQYARNIVAGISGISYQNYLASIRQPAPQAPQAPPKAADGLHDLTDAEATALVAMHLDLSTNQKFNVDPYKLYAPQLFDLQKHTTMSIESYLADVAEYEKKWPRRTFEIISVRRSISAIEFQCKYHCVSITGKVATGYTMIFLAINSSLQINGFFERTSKSPMQHTSGFKPVDYAGRMIFTTPNH